MKRLLKYGLLAIAFALAIPVQAQVNRITGPSVLDAGGASKVNWEGERASYFASLGNNTPAATPTDIAILSGSATKIVKVQRIRITVSSTAGSLIEWRLVMRSAGTQSAVNTAFANATHSGPFDSTDVVSTVIAAGLSGVYTANPASLGTVVGIVADWTITSPVSGGIELKYECSVTDKCITLRGVTQIIAVNGSSHTLATGEKVGVEFNWTEE